MKYENQKQIIYSYPYQKYGVRIPQCINWKYYNNAKNFVDTYLSWTQVLKLSKAD